MKSLRIRLKPDQHPEVWVHDGERRRHFFTTFSGLLGLLQEAEGRALREEAPWIPTPLLPPNTLYYAQRLEESWIVQDLPAGRYETLLDTGGREVFVIPLPRMLFAVHRRGSRVVGGAIRVTTETGAITNETPLFHFPLSNTYEDGRLCWYPPDDEAWTEERIPGLIRTFFATPHNFDVFSPRRNGPGHDLRGLITALAEHETYPTAWLVPAESSSAWLAHITR